jgi:hypothetical protein
VRSSPFGRLLADVDPGEDRTTRAGRLGGVPADRERLRGRIRDEGTEDEGALLLQDRKAPLEAEVARPVSDLDRVRAAAALVAAE